MTYTIGTGFAGKEIEELKAENNKLLDVINNQDVKIAALEKKVKEYEYLGIKELQTDAERLAKGNNYLTNQLEQAKGLLKEFVEWANWQGDNCPNFKDIQNKAGQFIKEGQ